MRQYTFKGIIASVLILLSISSYAGNITKYWSASSQNENSMDHTVWDQLLQKYVDTNNDNKFRYKDVTKSDKKALESYINTQAALNPLQYNKKEQYAYWINLYNAITINVVVDHYPVSSIKKIKLGKIFATGPWKSEVVTINDKELSLDNIEHDILRPIWNTPLTHYAVNCASIGCPNLSNTAFTPENTDELLHKNAIAFINSNKGFKLSNNRISLSKIYTWFKEDFGDSRENLRQHLRKYAKGERLKALEKEIGIVKFHYNWQLNGA